MEFIDEQTPIWEEIDRAENYLVCCMFEEAAALASSILKRLLEDFNISELDCEVSENIENEWDGMVESAGMVYVQSSKQLRKTSEILKELKLLFGSLNAIPVQLFVTGACFQMSESLLTAVQGSLEEFLNNWIYKDGRYYPLSGAEDSVSDTEGSSFMFSIGVNECLEVVDLYVIALLATALNDTDLAISWVEKAMLPMEKRQVVWRWIREDHQSRCDAGVNTYVDTSIMGDIDTELKMPELGDAYQRFASDCFGSFLLIQRKGYSYAAVIRCILAREIEREDAAEFELWFQLGEQFLHLSRQEYALHL